MLSPRLAVALHPSQQHTRCVVGSSELIDDQMAMIAYRATAAFKRRGGARASRRVHRGSPRTAIAVYTATNPCLAAL